jgi:hypothetical protein
MVKPTVMRRISNPKSMFNGAESSNCLIFILN